MCGACGERGAFDWARAWTAGLAARRAVAVAAVRAADRRGLRVTAGPGGWLVHGPTGAATACDGLGALVAAVRRWAGAEEPAPWDPARPSGRLTVPGEEDRRAGVVLRVAPGGARSPDTALAGPGDEVLVDSETTARAALAALASPRWSARRYLARVEGVAAAWARPLDDPGPQRPELAADVLLRLEWTRQSGRLDGTARAARGPLGPGAEYDVEIRDGHVVRARTVGD
ncbi:hypothetical protein [Streptomyces sp. RTd22]|uniref:hypothetical protein n=1 Tax=Streptomyces sp. RTd22 TaxID=1841249 RepID=UPI0007C4DEE3|nr:hypothetical protein [Streptomyces sp. RTd22]